MRKIFYLSSCSTCKRIINELQNVHEFDLQDIKTQPLNEEDLEMLLSAWVAMKPYLVNELFCTKLTI